MMIGQGILTETSTTGDPSFSSVILLLANENGANTSTTFTDASPLHNTVTRIGTAIWDNSQKPTGLTTSVLVPAASGISIPDGANVELGSGDFTIEVWVRTPTGTTQVILDKMDDGATSRCIEILFAAAAGINFYASSDGSSFDIANGQTLRASFAVDTWYALAVTRSGSTWAGYADGTRGFSFTSAATLFDSTAAWSVGSRATGGLGLQSGWVGAARVTKGVARYTGASYVVPSLPLPTS
jgi:hypothetical protein